MPNTTIITRDLLPSICKNLLSIKCLGVLCRVDKMCRNYLLDTSLSGCHSPFHSITLRILTVFKGNYWLQAGKHVCGEDFWNEKLFDHILKEEKKDGRYIAMLHLCPWISSPVVFHLRSLQAYDALDAIYELMDMKIDELLEEDEASGFYYDVIDDAKLLLLVSVRENDHVKGGPRVVHRMARDDDSGDTAYTTDVVDEAFFDSDPYASTTEVLLNRMRSDHCFMHATRRYGLGRLSEVRMVHQNMYAAIFGEGRTWRHSTILFCDYDTHRVMHEMRIRDGHPRCVVFRPGEMWVASSAGEVVYRGPNAQKTLGASRPNGCVTRAFFTAIGGNALAALKILRDSGINKDLSTIYIPKTTLSLFDIVADDNAFKNTDEVPSLSYEAARLLRREPRFANGIFMLKCAIRSMDMDKVTELVRAGCPWISNDDVADALPSGVVYSDGLELLRPRGVRITYRY